MADAVAKARALRRAGVLVVVIDAEPVDPRPGELRPSARGRLGRHLPVGLAGLAGHVRGGAGGVSGVEFTIAQAATLEALGEPRTGLTSEALDPAMRAALEELGLSTEEARAAVERVVAARSIEWADRRLTHGELLAGFARHCTDELDEVTVEEVTSTTLVARWRAEMSRIELRAGTVAVERLVSDTPTMLITELGDDAEALVARFLDSAELRSRGSCVRPDAAGKGRRRALERVRLLRMAPPRLVRREGAAKPRVHTRSRRSRRDLTGNGLEARASIGRMYAAPYESR